GQLTTNDPWRAWVAETDGRIVGQVWVHLIQKIPNPNDERERYAYLSNLFVTPAARGGLGTRLLETAIQWCERALVDSVLLRPTPRSRALYLRNGFTDRFEFLELRLPRVSH